MQVHGKELNLLRGFATDFGRFLLQILEFTFSCNYPRSIFIVRSMLQGKSFVSAFLRAKVLYICSFISKEFRDCLAQAVLYPENLEVLFSVMVPLNHSIGDV